MPNTVPYLCGGTFFVLLTEAKGRTRTQRQRQQSADTINNKNMLEYLIKIYKPTFSQPSYRGTFDGETTNYKACKVSYSFNLPFNDDVLIAAFGNRVKTEYASLLEEMKIFVYTFLDYEDKARMTWLTKALLEIIKESVGDDTKLYAFESGKPVSKQELLTETEYNLPALLLGIWHYIITERKDNEKGRDTYEAWHIPPRENNSRWKFNSTIGKYYSRRISYRLEVLDEKKGSTTDTESAFEPEVIEIEANNEDTSTPRINEYEVDSKDPITQQKIVAQFHVEAKDNGIAVGQLFGDLVIGNRDK